MVFLLPDQLYFQLKKKISGNIGNTILTLVAMLLHHSKSIVIQGQFHLFDPSKLDLFPHQERYPAHPFVIYNEPDRPAVQTLQTILSWAVFERA